VFFSERQAKNVQSDALASMLGTTSALLATLYLSIKE
jgi:hypothetical protein